MAGLWRRLASDVSGSVLVETSVLAPMLIVVFVGAMQFGPLLQQNETLELAARQGAQVLSAGRTDATVYTDTTNAISKSIATLSGTTTVTVSICNASGASCTACASNSACSTQLSSAQGHAALVTLSYPCTLAYRLFNLGSVCSLSASEYVLIQ